MILAKAVNLKDSRYAVHYFKEILFQLGYDGPLATGIAEILRGWRNVGNEGSALEKQVIISEIVARAQPRDDSWFTLASKELIVPEAVLRDHAARGDSLSLAILIYLSRQQFSHLANQNWPSYMISFVLGFASQFNVRDTLPELQHEFCVLWNEIVRKVQNENDRDMAKLLIGQIHQVYVNLHTDPVTPISSTFDLRIPEDSSSYAVCNVPEHWHYWHSYPIPFILPDLPRLHNDHFLPSYSFSSSLDTTRTRAESTNTLPLDNSIAIPVNTTTEIRPMLSSSPDPATIVPMYGGVYTSRMMNLPPMGLFPFPFPSEPRASTSPTDAVAAQPTSVSHAAWGDHAYSFPESRYSILAANARRSSSASDLGAAAMREDSENAALRKGKEKAVPYPSSAIHEDATMVAMDVFSRPPSPQSILAVTSPVLSSSPLDAEDVHGQQDIV